MAICGDDQIKALLLERILWEGKKTSGGWINRSSRSLSNSVFSGSSTRTVRRRISAMVEAGLLEEDGNRIKANRPRIKELAEERGFMIDSKWDPNEEWEDMCKEEDTRREQAGEVKSEEQKELALKQIETISGYCKQYRQLDSAPDFAKAVSWYMWDVAAIEPYGKAKQWIAACHDLWEASGSNEEVLKDALTTGNTLRVTRGLTMSGPRSFVKFALDAKSRRKLQGRGVGGPGTASGNLPQPLFGQRVEDGKIKLGRK